jgi:MFS family permease
VLREHRRVLVTVGSAVVVIGVARSLRATVLPLWADHVGISAEATSLVFGLAALVEIALVYPAGWTMDRFGRTVVAVPVVGLIGLGVALLPLAQGLPLFAGLAVLMAVGNGMGSGIVMTLGADTAPTAGRAQYLGGWRLAGDVGTTAGPVLVAALAAVAPLAVACVATGGICLLGTLWVRRQVGQAERRRHAHERGLRPGEGASGPPP